MSIPALEPGIQEQINATTDQRYTIAIPNGYNGQEAIPIVLALHYGWQGELPPFFGKRILTRLVEPALYGLGALLVAPDCQSEHWATPQSEADLKALLVYLQARYPIRPERILLIVMSRGGTGVWYLAARNQDLFSAVIPISARPQPDSADIHWQIPLYVIHSRSDEVIPYEPVAQVVCWLKEKGARIEFALLDEPTHFQTERFVVFLHAAVPWIKKQLGS